jgi:hypothetical protein
MLEELIALIVDESKWLTASMGVALLATLASLYRTRRSDLRSRIQAAMSLFFGVTIGTMAFGHLLAVTIKLAGGTLEASLPIFYLIGTALAVLSWWLIYHAHGIAAANAEHDGTTLRLNAWLALTLLAMGPQNLPLAAPGFLGIGYQLHSRPAIGWAIVAGAVLLGAGLFIGSLVFLASGQTFDEFSL